MKTSFWQIYKLTAIAAILVALPTQSFAGPRDSGGGDEYTLDFVATAYQEIYPWLKLNGSQLNPAVDAGNFLLALNPEGIASVEKVYESCRVVVQNQGQSNQQLVSTPQSLQDREVQACYDGSKFIYVSRSLYPLSTQNSPNKRGLIAHEIFRKMGIEGNKYEISRQIPIVSTPSALQSIGGVQLPSGLSVQYASPSTDNGNTTVGSYFEATYYQHGKLVDVYHQGGGDLELYQPFCLLDRPRSTIAGGGNLDSVSAGMFRLDEVDLSGAEQTFGQGTSLEPIVVSGNFNLTLASQDLLISCGRSYGDQLHTGPYTPDEATSIASQALGAKLIQE